MFLHSSCASSPCCLVSFCSLFISLSLCMCVFLCACNRTLLLQGWDPFWLPTRFSCTLRLMRWDDFPYHYLKWDRSLNCCLMRTVHVAGDFGSLLKGWRGSWPAGLWMDRKWQKEVTNQEMKWEYKSKNRQKQKKTHNKNRMKSLM